MTETPRTPPSSGVGEASQASRARAPSRDFVLIHRVGWRRDLWACAVLLAALVVIRFDAFSNITSRYLGGFERDAGLYSWLVDSNLRDLFTLPWFNTRGFYPYSLTLAWSDNFILPSLFIGLLLKLPLTWLEPHQHFAFSYNAALLTASFLNGIVTYALIRSLSGDWLASLSSGATFMGLSALSSHLGHPQLQFAFFFPLALLLVFRFLSCTSIWWPILLGLTTFAAFLTTVYYSIFLIVIVGGLLLAVVLLRPWQLTSRDLVRFIGGTAIGFSPIIAVLEPYIHVRDTFNERALYEPFFFSATGLSYLSASSFNWLYAWTSSWSHTEAHLFGGTALLIGLAFIVFRLWDAKRVRKFGLIAIGFIVTAAILSSVAASEAPSLRYLTAITLWGAIGASIVYLLRFGALERSFRCLIFTNRDIGLALLFTSLLFFAVSLGPLGNVAKDELALGPYTLFYYLVPGFNAIRAIGRAGIVVLFLCTALWGLTLANLNQNRKTRRGILLCLSLLPLIENYNSDYPLEPETPPSPVFYQLAQQPDKLLSAIALPLADELDSNGEVNSWSEFAKLNVYYMHWFSVSDRPFVNGYSGQRSKFMKEFPRKFAGFPDQRSLDALAMVGGLKYVVYASRFAKNFDQVQFNKKIAQMASSLKLLMSDGDGNYLFELTNTTRIKDNFSVLVPSYPEGIFNVELMTPYHKGNPKVSVDILIKDHFGDDPIRNALLTANGEWERFSFPLPVTSDRVRPLKVSFEIKGESPVFLRNSRFEPG